MTNAQGESPTGCTQFVAPSAIESPRNAAGARIPESPLLTVEITDTTVGLEGFVCIHSMGKRGTSGGMRCVDDISKHEVQILARAMAYKYAFYRIQQGGAKAGLRIDWDESPEQRRRLLCQAARHLEPLIKRHLWSPGTDMNFYEPDLAVFTAAIGIAYSPGGDGGGSSYRTAVSGFASLQVVLDRMRLLPEETRVSLEGFGSVARYLVPFLKQYGVRLIAVSTHAGCVYNPTGLDLDSLLRAQARGHPDWIKTSGPWERLPKEAIFDLDVDVFIPCARVHSLNEQRAAAIRARVVLPIANVPCTDAALHILDHRNIPYVPDYVVNGGGVCGHIMGGASPARPVGVQTFVEVFKPMLRRLLDAAEVSGVPPRLLADEVAHSGYEAQAQEAYEETHLGTRAVRRLQQMHLLPGDSYRQELRRRVDRTVHHLGSLYR